MEGGQGVQSEGVIEGERVGVTYFILSQANGAGADGEWTEQMVRAGVRRMMCWQGLAGEVPQQVGGRGGVLKLKVQSSTWFNSLYVSRYSHDHVPKQAPPKGAIDKLINAAN